MKTILRYVKPFTLLILFCIVLLFCQALCDLNLPDLMSDIINVGIQAEGVELGAPKVVSTEAMGFLLSFLSDDDKDSFSNAYTLVKVDEVDSVGKAFSFDSRTEVYVLKEKGIDKKEINSLYTSANSLLISTVKYVASMQGAAGNSMPSMFSEEGGFSEVSIKQLYMLQEVTKRIPDEVLNDIKKEAESLDPMIIGQVSSMFTRIYYAELGVDFKVMQNEYILDIGLKMLLLTLLATTLSISIGFIASRVGASISKTLRHDIFNKVMHFSNAEIDKFSTASLITRTTNDVSQIQMLIMMSIRMVFYSPIMGIGGVIMARGKSTSLTWIIVLAIALIIVLVLVVFFVAMPKFNLQQKLIDRVNLISRENLSGLMVIRAFTNEKHEEERFDVANTDLTNTNRFVGRTMSILFPTMSLFMNIIILMILWVGSNAIAASTMNVGDVIAFIQYSMHIIMSFIMISAIFVIFPRAAVSVKRVAEVLETDYTILDPKKPTSVPSNISGEVKFNNVSFRYENAESNALEDISFTAVPGEVTAIIGSTGSGKTTLVNLIPRLYDVTDGSITIDGIDVRDVSQKDLREQIGYVAQKGVLFTGDIESNIRYGKEGASEDEIRKAIEIAQAEDFVNDRDGGLNADISRGGANVSGGQRQRLSIARALVKKPPIYIFDDTFSALDFKTDASLRKALNTYTNNATVIIVAQRIGTIMNADKILVLDHGKVIGIGTHKELLANCDTYREIAETQLSKEEL